MKGIPLSFRSVPDKLCYRALVGKAEGDGWTEWTQMWRWKIPPKVKHFFGRLLPTKLILKNRFVNCVDCCRLGGMKEETLQHLFVSCPITMEAWDSINWSWSSSSGQTFLDGRIPS
ncbi:unnamed protein product [Cuscuta europaea]|uniref:Reverse transcriptase zinc-binding domain-containing protein n=1 Tax=Cuscuta europaea TaxID=41803 RepID=A0A9P0Z007_CUSEU|nr:unnamed protein product [Cuscuta europaea]